MNIIFVTCRPQLDKKAILESYDLAILALDEIIDRGLVLETDAKEVLGKISTASTVRPGGGGSLGEHLNEQTISTAFQMAKEQMKTFLR